MAERKSTLRLLPNNNRGIRVESAARANGKPFRLPVSHPSLRLVRKGA